MATDTVVLNIRGMECEACVGHVLRALRDVPGVSSAEVNLADERASVAYDPGQASLGDLVHAVDEEGYTAERIAQ